MIDQRLIATLINIFNFPELTFIELAIKTKTSSHQIIEDLKSMNQVLESHDLPQIALGVNSYTIPEELIQEQNKIYNLFYSNNITFDHDKRMNIVFLYVFIRQAFVSNFHIQNILHVSKNTALNDIRRLREACQDYQVEFIYSRSKGYHLKGSEINKQRYALYCISELIDYGIGEWVLTYILEEVNERDRIEDLFEDVQAFEKQSQLQSIKDKLQPILYLFQFLVIRSKQTGHLIEGIDLDGQPELVIVESLVQHLLRGYSTFEDLTPNSAQFRYIEYLVLGGFMGSQSEVSSFFVELTQEIIQEMEAVSLIRFTHKEELFEGLIKHLVPAYYRLKTGFIDYNPYTKMIKKEYRYIFEIVERALKPLEMQVGRNIPDSEISYFVIHFGGYLSTDKVSTNSHLRALIVCPNGVSSSLVIKRQLEDYFPNIEFLDNYRYDQIASIDETSYDLIFSTIPLESDKPVFMVSLFMNGTALDQLYQMVVNTFPMKDLYPYEMVQVMELIDKHTTIHNDVELRLELINFFENRTYQEEEDYPMLSELITEETFQTSDEKLGWKEAIALASQPLLDKGYIDEEYIDAMISRVDEYGPFFDLGKGIAIPHARPEDGVNELSMSMLTLTHPSYLQDDEDHPMQLIVVIAASDNKRHLEALSHLTIAIRDDENIETLIKAREYDEIKSIIKSEED